VLLAGGPASNCSGFAGCIPSACACTQGPGFTVAPGDACLRGDVSECSCDRATCANPYDSCGRSVCPGVCELGEPCEFCLDPSEPCRLIDPCFGSFCIYNYSHTKAVCRSAECQDRIQPPLCGSVDAPCGEECCPADCADRECGPDPRCLQSCGTCEVGSYCVADGKCVLDSAVAFGSGLRALALPEGCYRGVFAARMSSAGRCGRGRYGPCPNQPDSE
jgi:hypothetical protein